MGIFEQLAWLTNKVKKLCCAVEQLQQGGGTQSYKVYTALLTQSGGDDFDSIAAGNTTIGITYQINGSIAGDDFRNIGGPLITTNGEFQGTYFVATGTTPTNWSGNTVLIYNTGAPVVTVLENTIGNIWFTYTGVGDYSINSDGLFENLKTYYSILSISDTATQQRNGLFVINTNQIGISSGDGNIYENGYLFRTPIEIRVYN
jgi:hypothetical protein